MTTVSLPLNQLKGGFETKLIRDRAAADALSVEDCWEILDLMAQRGLETVADRDQVAMFWTYVSGITALYVLNGDKGTLPEIPINPYDSEEDQGLLWGIIDEHMPIIAFHIYNRDIPSLTAEIEGFALAHAAHRLAELDPPDTGKVVIS